jgi:NAD(P)-dependent dehydrogenase (short-subunit alcohol dehydrogenase family)
VSSSAPDWSLAGKVAIVTGASVGGIGETYARGLRTAGASVVVADIDEDAAGEVAASLDGAVGCRVDVTDPGSVARLVERATDAFGGVDILVNNAALMEVLSKGPLLELDLEEWNRAFAVNLTGAYLCTRAVVPSMRQRGGGRIVNQISAAAYPPVTVYALSKHALAGLTTALARELGPDRIAVNGIAPGMVASAAGDRQLAAAAARGHDLRASIEATVAGRGEGAREDLLGALMLLVSVAGDWITGQILHVDGGWVMRP